MNLKPGIFTLLALAACLFAAEVNAQVILRGYVQSGVGIARAYATNTRQALQNGQVVRYGSRNAGVQFGGGPGFRAGNRRWGAQFGNGNGLQAGRLNRRW